MIRSATEASSTQVRRFHARSEWISGAAYRTEVHACLLDTGTAHRVRADEPVLRPGGRVAACLKSSVSGHTRCDSFYSSVSFTPQFVIYLSQFQGKESKDHSTHRRTICAARPFTKFVSGSSPTPRQSGKTSASSEAHLGRPQQHSAVHFHNFLPKTSLRGIGLCNGYDTNFPYKWTSSTYSQRQQFWLDPSVMRSSCSPCNWAVGKINAALSSPV